MVEVKKKGEKFKCNVCGNEVEVTKAGGGELVCCSQPMELVTGETETEFEEVSTEESATEDEDLEF